MKSKELRELFELVRDRKITPEQALAVARGKASLATCLSAVGEDKRVETLIEPTNPAGGTAPFESNRIEVVGCFVRNKNAFLHQIQQHLFSVFSAKKIVLHAPRHPCGGSPPVINDGCFHLWLWTSPRSSDACVPATLWGISVDARNEGYRPSGLGIAILDSGGWPVGELVDDNFYIHWDCCETGSKQELAIFGQMMKELAVAISANKDKK